MDFKKITNWRYSTKEFDPEKKLSDEQFEQVKTLLRMSPSSTNIQPWHFIIASTQEGKKRMAKGTQGFFSFNAPKVLDASHVILFCSRIDADDEYMHHLLDKEDEDGRYAKPEFKEQMHGARQIFANIHRFDLKDLSHWMDKQVYLNMGSLLLGVAALGIDSVPMEGIDIKTIDQEFGLREKGYSAVGIVSLGFRKETDFNASLPKSRLSEEDIFTIL
ncbi:oxygen-insensitive NAD(P)H nitroreductase [Neolewinella agarilytica]|uniref:Nitroreductase / dihydropteridine reductase n=1 Tax=Neolewinella agarilytica TaxID=478744 RepID=A0A1H8ZQL6_9BACT|nr:oxygen-insensitive NAD(P)H nitroreductase [Neolewinella agarilytica]SEP66786.1 nitroreductase / dihydropteridine reductase [Neolewinella agarilytica]